MSRVHPHQICTDINQIIHIYTNLISSLYVVCSYTWWLRVVTSLLTSVLFLDITKENRELSSPPLCRNMKLF